MKPLRVLHQYERPIVDSDACFGKDLTIELDNTYIKLEFGKLIFYQKI